MLNVSNLGFCRLCKAQTSIDPNPGPCTLRQKEKKLILASPIGMERKIRFFFPTRYQKSVLICSPAYRSRPAKILPVDRSLVPSVDRGSILGASGCGSGTLQTGGEFWQMDDRRSRIFQVNVGYFA